MSEREHDTVTMNRSRLVDGRVAAVSDLLMTVISGISSSSSSTLTTTATTTDVLLEDAIASLDRMITTVTTAGSSSSLNPSSSSSSTTSSLHQTFVDRVVDAATSLYNISTFPMSSSISTSPSPSPPKKRKEIWDALQNAAISIVSKPDSNNGNTTLLLPLTTSDALSVASILAALSILYPPPSSLFTNNNNNDEKDTTNYADTNAVVGPSRAAASAITTVITSRLRRCKWSKDGIELAIRILKELLVSSYSSPGIVGAAAVGGVVDLQLVTFLARSFQITAVIGDEKDGGEEEEDGSTISYIATEAIRQAVCLHDHEYSNRVVLDGDGDGTSNGAGITNTQLVPQKQTVAAALGLAQQIAPWAILSPVPIVEIAITFDLWHGAETICASSSTTTISNTNKSNAINGRAIQAVHTLIDAALEAKLYRHADTFATTFYDVGGRSRFIEARLLHAYNTIAKVVQKGQISLVERQVERIDRAVVRVTDDEPVICNDDGTESTTTTTTTTTTTMDAKSEIRTYALRRLEEATQTDAALRLARIWGILDYHFDEEVAKAAFELRKKKYIQFEDVMPVGVPGLICTPKDLVTAFELELGFEVGVVDGNVDENISDDNVNGDGGLREETTDNVEQRSSIPSSSPFSSTIVVGFDAEWGDDHAGVDILQIATTDAVILIDIPAVSMSPGGGNALERTVGRLFDRRLQCRRCVGCGENGGCDDDNDDGDGRNVADIVVVGFSCKQDLSRLRSSPCTPLLDDYDDDYNDDEVTPHPRQKRKRKRSHWLSGTSAVLDAKNFGEEYDEPKLKRLGLSRFCEFYLGKPLDKAEQCSMWSVRPLSLEQRAYAALDAWVCVAIYDKVFGVVNGGNNGGGKSLVEATDGAVLAAANSDG